MSPTAQLIGAQLLAALALSVPAVGLIGACAGWVPILGTAAGAFATWLVWGRLAPERLTRPSIRRMALRSGAAHALVVAASYVACYSIFPDSFSFEPLALVIIAPVLGLGGGGVALAMTLVAGDGAAAALGVELQPPDPRN